MTGWRTKKIEEEKWIENIRYVIFSASFLLSPLLIDVKWRLYYLVADKQFWLLRSRGRNNLRMELGTLCVYKFSAMLLSFLYHHSYRLWTFVSYSICNFLRTRSFGYKVDQVTRTWDKKLSMWTSSLFSFAFLTSYEAPTLLEIFVFASDTPGTRKSSLLWVMSRTRTETWQGNFNRSILKAFRGWNYKSTGPKAKTYVLYRHAPWVNIAFNRRSNLNILWLKVCITKKQLF